MSANSPIYNCTAGTTVTANTTDPYCLVRHGAQRMDLCCSSQGNGIGPVQFQPDCYPWCKLDIGKNATRERFLAATRNFYTCLTTGVNASSPAALAGMLCSAGYSPPETIDAPQSTGVVPSATPTPTHSSDAVVLSANPKVFSLFMGLLLMAVLGNGN